MKDLLVLLAPGFEEVEALAVVDIARRADLAVDTASCRDDGEHLVESSHGIPVQADVLFDDVKNDTYRAVYIPGGMGGATTLAKHEGVLAYIKEHVADSYIAAICAGPMVLHAAGLDKGKKGTIYPGMENEVDFAERPDALVVQDGNVISSLGPASAPVLGLYLVKLLKGDAAYEEVKKGILVPQLLKALDADTLWSIS